MLKWLFLFLVLFNPVLLASDTPSDMPSDANGKSVSLQYYQRSSNDSQAVEYYEEATLRSSAALVAATGRSNSTAVTDLETYTIAVIHLDVTVATRPDTNESLDVVVETSHDGGTTWLRMARFTTVTAVGDQVLVLRQDSNVTPVANADSSDPNSGAISFGAFGDRIRVASTVTDAAGANATFTFSVKAFFKKG